MWSRQQRKRLGVTLCLRLTSNPLTLHLLVTGVYVFDVLLNENLILSIHALLCSLLIYLRNFWSIVNFVSRLLHGFNWIARQSAIQNYAVTIKNRSRLWSSWCSTVHFDKWQWSFVKNCSFDEKVQRMDHTPKPSALIFH